MTSGLDWATHGGDAWTRRWRETDRGLANLQASLHAALIAAAPDGPFRALDIGCGPGSTSLELVGERPDASIIACDVSPPLVKLARDRLAGHAGVQVVLGDAQEVARREGPFDLIFSRHGVMFFDDPIRAFRTIRSAANDGARLVFSCFRDWQANAWASELSEAAAGRPLPPPGREPSGFAFADPDYVGTILQSAGWAAVAAEPVAFRYVAGTGPTAVDDGLDYLAEIGPASRTLREMPEHERDGAMARMRQVLDRYCVDGRVDFPAAAWIWRARAE